METISKLKTEAMFLNAKLEEMTKYVRMLNNGSDSLDKILQTGQITGDKSGIGYNNSKPESSDTGVYLSTVFSSGDVTYDVTSQVFECT